MQREKLTPEELQARREASRRLMERQEAAMAESLAIFEDEITGKRPPTKARNPLLEWA